MIEEFLWVEKYRPQYVEDAILPVATKAKFQQFISDENIPNLILAGSAGTGKTTAAKAMLNELGCDYIVINGSLDGNIDTLRNTIRDFASTVSFAGGRKYVILDEADYLNPQSTQPALRNFMEEFSKNCGFILTCNFPNRIIEPLHSRCSVVEFKIDNKEKPSIAAGFFKHVCKILEREKIEYDRKAVAMLVEKHFPDFRRVINELQSYSATGKIDSGILTNKTEQDYRDLMDLIKTKNFTEVRKWVADNSDADPGTFFTKLYEIGSEMVDKSSVPQLVLIVADYQYKQAFVMNNEINMTACLTEIMAGCTFP